jgi:hypothetical protein
VVASGRLYYLDQGGFSVKYANLNSNGANGSWSTASNSPVFGTFDHVAFVNSGILYRINGTLCAFFVCDSQPLVSTAKILPNGDLGPWLEHQGDPLVALSGQAGVITNGKILMIGGDNIVTNVSNLTNRVDYTLTRRVEVAGALDLTSLANASESDYGSAVSLKAGNTEIAGALSVFGDASTRGRLSVLGDVNFAANQQLAGNLVFEQEINHTIKLANSTTAATAGAALTISGADGNGAIGGAISIMPGTGTTGGALNLTGGTSTGFTPGGAVNITGGTGFAGGNVVINGGVGVINGNVLIASSGGRLGVGNSTPGFLQHVGSASTASGTTVTRFQNAGGVCDVTPNIVGGVTCTSDARFKKNITELTTVLEKIGAIKVYQYNLTVENDDDPMHVGFLAQELEQIIPDLVHTDADGNKSVSYAGLVPYLVQAVKQQQEQINELKNVKNNSNTVSIDVVNELARAEVITINGTLFVNGRIELSMNNKGKVKIPAGVTKLKVDFLQKFNSLPTVVISANDFIDGAYRTTNVQVSSFEIELSKAQAADVEFNWQAF